MDWFNKEKRDLPWRTHPTLYKTVVSEFMLQQTQVETVVPYFTRWIKSFPGFEELAGASEQSVMKHWEGLGYYSRARNLHKLAKSIAASGIPGAVDEWLDRPGIGPYTAAAISSIAQNVPEPVIDGNVIRVLTRIKNDENPVTSTEDGRKRLLPLARELIDHETPGAFNEAMMELGATVCRKSNPGCGGCPVREHCVARLEGDPSLLPVIPKKSTVHRNVCRLWLVKDHQLLLHVYPDSAKRLAGLAELPEIDKPDGAQPIVQKTRGIANERIRESIFSLPLDHPASEASTQQEECLWVPVENLAMVSISGPHRRWIDFLVKEFEKR